MTQGGRRVALAVAGAAVVALGLVVSRGDGMLADLAGGALYAALVYALAALVAPRARSWVVGLVALVLSVGVELLQLTDLPRAVVDEVPLARYVLGTTFVATDLLAYAAGAATATGADVVLRRVGGARRSRVSGRDPRRPA